MVGIHAHPVKLASDIRTIRRNGRIDEFVSVNIDEVRKLVNVNSDSGRLVRPLIIVKDGVPQLQQSDLEILKRFDARTAFS